MSLRYVRVDSYILTIRDSFQSFTQIESFLMLIKCLVLKNVPFPVKIPINFSILKFPNYKYSFL